MKKIKGMLEEYSEIIAEIDKIADENKWSTNMHTVLKEQVDLSVVGIIHTYLISNNEEYVTERVSMIDKFRTELRKKKYSSDEIIAYISSWLGSGSMG